MPLNTCIYLYLHAILFFIAYSILLYSGPPANEIRISSKKQHLLLLTRQDSSKKQHLLLWTRQDSAQNKFPQVYPQNQPSSALLCWFYRHLVAKSVKLYFLQYTLIKNEIYKNNPIETHLCFYFLFASCP